MHAFTGKKNCDKSEEGPCICTVNEHSYVGMYPHKSLLDFQNFHIPIHLKLRIYMWLK